MRAEGDLAKQVCVDAQRKYWKRRVYLEMSKYTVYGETACRALFIRGHGCQWYQRSGNWFSQKYELYRKDRLPTISPK